MSAPGHALRFSPPLLLWPFLLLCGRIVGVHDFRLGKRPGCWKALYSLVVPKEPSPLVHIHFMRCLGYHAATLESQNRHTLWQGSAVPLFFSSYSPSICQHPLLVIGRGESVPHLVIEVGTVWLLMLLLNRGILTKGKKPHLLDTKLGTEYFPLWKADGGHKGMLASPRKFSHCSLNSASSFMTASY